MSLGNFTAKSLQLVDASANNVRMAIVDGYFVIQKYVSASSSWVTMFRNGPVTIPAEPASTVIPNLISYMPFNGSAADSKSLASYQYTAGPSDLFTTGKYSNAIDLTGSIIRYNYSTLHQHSQLTWSFWYRFPFVGSWANITMAIFEDDGGQLIARADNTAGATTIRFYFLGASGEVTKSSFDFSAFHMYTYVMNLSTGTVTFYIDGTQQFVSDSSSVVTGFAVNRQKRVYYGNFGAIWDDVRIYSRALTGTEVSTLASATDITTITES